MKKTIALLIIITTISSCKKYEDGPSFSLKTKTNRVANDWVIDQFVRDGIDSTSTYAADGSGLVLTKEGKADYTQYRRYTSGTLDTTVILTATGTWEFDDKKEYIGFILTDNVTNQKDTSVFLITLLKEKEMSLRSTDDSKYVDEYRLIPK